MLNAYGPTEATVCASIGECEVGEKAAAVTAPPIGRPMANTELYILDERMEPVAMGVRGELYIGGRGVGRGYLNQPELTAERFLPHPFSREAGERLYRTGDLARYMPDGNIEYLGRIDEQVKIRGYRIELGEIEAVLRGHESVREAVVILREDVPGEKRLVAYVVAAGEQQVTSSLLREHLRTKLPDYMLPSAFVQLEALPLTPNGKVDRKALAKLEHNGRDAEESFVAPRTAPEELLASIWSEVLRVERVGVNDSFFELGGHSLLATQLVSRIREAFNVELPLTKLFETPTVADISGIIEAERRGEKKFQAPPIEPVSREAVLPLSFAQQRLWFLDQLEPGSSLYNILTAVRLTGRLNVSALEQTLSEIIRRHEVLRTSFPVIDGNPRQLIAPAQPVHLSVINLSELTEADSEAEVRRIAAEQAQRPFDLAQGPLLRVSLLRLSEESHALIFTMHHIISDGWSMGVLIREVATLYEAYCEGRPSPLPELNIQYADFAHWQRQWLQGEVLEAQLAYWEQQLGGTLPVLELPTDRPRPAVQSYHGATRSFMLDKGTSEALRDLSRQKGVTLFMTLLAAFQTLLARYTGQGEIIVGTDIANRNRGETEALIGFFVNQLVMRTDFSDDPTFSELLRRVREATLAAYMHQDLPFELLVQRLQPERDLSRAPIFQTKLVLQNVPHEELKLPGLTLGSVAVENVAARFDLTLVMLDLPDGLSGFIEYNTDLFDDSRMMRLLDHFNRLLEGIVAGPERRVSELPLLSNVERQQALIEWNRTEVERPHNASIHQFFEAQAAQTPEAIAVTFQDQELTYDELNRRANQLAHHLRRIGIGPEVRVGILMERSLEMLVGVLGILKAGGAFMPLDPEYSIGRLSFMLEDAQVPLLLTQERSLDGLPAFWGQVICLDSEWENLAGESEHNPTNITEAANLAYVIYTSGSTGRPKGVLLQHGGLCNLALEQIRAFKVQPGSRVLQFASLSFDASVWEIFMALTSGATLCLGERAKLSSGAELVEVLRERGVTVATLPPAILSVMPAPALPALQTLIAAGEKCSREILEKWSADRHFFNAYGPTESTVCATMTERTGNDSQEPPIGRPIANTQVYLLDAKLQPVPVGVTGELHIGGAGLARGYLNQPALTAEKFIPHPFSREAGARLYRTGDLARYLPDGQIEFIGRADEQVKLRGHRIELGEIEVALSQHRAVREAVIALREDEPGEKRLVAYLVLEGETPASTSDIRSYLQEQLPSYMIPAAFVWLEELPLTRNGKIDRRALPAPELAGVGSGDSYIAPRTPTEELMASLWSEVLKVERVGACDNFFELGGHSLLATQLISRIREAFNVELLLVTLFEKPTVEQLSQAVEQRRTEQEAPAVNRITRRGSDQASLELDGLSEEEVTSLLSEMMAEEQVNL
jgi:amino acid adenylation domain-containing protein